MSVLGRVTAKLTLVAVALAAMGEHGEDEEDLTRKGHIAQQPWFVDMREMVQVSFRCRAMRDKQCASTAQFKKQCTREPK